MNNVRQALLDIAGSITDDCTFDEVIYRLELRAMVERGERDIEAGRYVSHKEAVQRINGWLRTAEQAEDREIE
jgi:predicted transcriptional regulator